MLITTSDNMNKPLTDEAHILFIELIGATGALARLYEGSAKAWREAREEAVLWDAAGDRYKLQVEELKERLHSLGYAWTGNPIDEWPELITESEQ